MPGKTRNITENGHEIQVIIDLIMDNSLYPFYLCGIVCLSPDSRQKKGAAMEELRLKPPKEDGGVKPINEAR